MENDNTHKEDFDVSQIQDMIKSQVEAHIQQLTPKPQNNSQDDARKQLESIIKPIIQDDINNAQLTSADAKDYVDFYIANPDALEYKDQVEKVFNEQKNNGRPTPRDSILKYILGTELVNNPDDFIKKQQERLKKKLDKVREAEDRANSGIVRNDVQWISDFSKLSLEDMEKVLEGHTF